MDSAQNSILDPTHPAIASRKLATKKLFCIYLKDVLSFQLDRCQFWQNLTTLFTFASIVLQHFCTVGRVRRIGASTRFEDQLLSRQISQKTVTQKTCFAPILSVFPAKCTSVSRLTSTVIVFFGFLMVPSDKSVTDAVKQETALPWVSYEIGGEWLHPSHTRAAGNKDKLSNKR